MQFLWKSVPFPPCSALIEEFPFFPLFPQHIIRKNQQFFVDNAVEKYDNVQVDFMSTYFALEETMGFLSELKKLTQPYDDEDDFFDGSDESFKAPTVISDAQKQLEHNFAGQASAESFDDDEEDEVEESGSRPGGFFAALGARKPAKPRLPLRERTVNFGGTDTQVILFNPKTFEEAGDLVNHLLNSRSVVMTLEGVDTDLARRLLDFMSGIAFSLQGKITPISGKTYFVTPQNVDVVGAQAAAGVLGSNNG